MLGKSQGKPALSEDDDSFRHLDSRTTGRFLSPVRRRVAAYIFPGKLRIFQTGTSSLRLPMDPLVKSISLSSPLDISYNRVSTPPGRSTKEITPASQVPLPSNLNQSAFGLRSLLGSVPVCRMPNVPVEVEL